MQATASLELGQAAPEFKLKGPGGQYVTLSEFRGKKNVLLVFYPLAFSPVCSHQLPMIQGDLRRFEATDTEVMGISVDSHYANDAFALHLGLSFPLLSDFEEKGRVARLYESYDEEEGCCKRTLYVLNEEGIVHWSYESPVGINPGADGIMEALDTLN